MKLQDLFELKAPKMKAADASAHYEKFKAMLEKGHPGASEQMVKNLKVKADELWDQELRAKEKNIIDTHGAEWWDLVKKQYPITQKDNDWVVTSKVRDWSPDSKKEWPFQYKAQAVEKVQKLIAWLHQGRKRGFGDKDADIQKWLNALDAVDKSTITESTNHVDEKEYGSWSSWRAAVKKHFPDFWIDGDRDIASAMIGPKPYEDGETKSVGEWDGEKGVVYGCAVKEAQVFNKGLAAAEAGRGQSARDVNNQPGFFKKYKEIAVKYGWKQRADHMHHPLHGTIDVNRYGEWSHQPHGSKHDTDGFGGSNEANFEKHLKKLRDQE